MRLKISLTTQSRFLIKLQYKSALQAVVYSMLDKPYAEWLHNQGFKYEKRSFKQFTFSGFNEKYKFIKDTNEFLFPQEQIQNNVKTQDLVSQKK